MGAGAVCGCGVRPLQNQCAHTCVCGSESGCAVCVRATKKRVATHPLQNRCIRNYNARYHFSVQENLITKDGIKYSDYHLWMSLMPLFKSYITQSTFDTLILHHERIIKSGYITIL